MTENQRRDDNPSGEMSREEFREHAGDIYASFALSEDDDFTDTVARFEQTQHSLVGQIRARDPDGEVMAPPEPWVGRLEPTKTTRRFHLLHLIEEVARHAGNADIIREQLDGATAIELTLGSRAAKATTTSRPGSRRLPSESHFGQSPARNSAGRPGIAAPSGRH